MKQNQEPHWQPIEQLPVIAQYIDGTLAWAIEHHETLLEAKKRPYTLDDYTVQRIARVLTEQQDDLWLFDEQLVRWQREQLTQQQKEEVERLVIQMKRWREVVAAILKLADELKENTIEKFLEKDDVEVAIEYLSGKQNKS